MNETEPKQRVGTARHKRSYICDRCGFEMYEANCKVICPNCGSRYDCSDLTIYLDDDEKPAEQMPSEQAGS